MFYEAVVFYDEGLELVFVFGCLLLVGLDLFTSTVNVVTSVLKSLLCHLSGLFLFSEAVLKLVQELAVGCLTVIQCLICLLQLLNGLKHVLAFFVVPGDDLILLLQGFRKREDLCNLIDAFFLLLIRGLAPRLTGHCSTQCLKSHAGLQRAIPSFLPHLQPQPHLLQPLPQHRILRIHSSQLLMQRLYLHTLSPILPLQTLSIIIQQADPILQFVRIHNNILKRLSNLDLHILLP